MQCFFYVIHLQFDCYKVFYFYFLFLIDVKYGALCWNVNYIDHVLILN